MIRPSCLIFALAVGTATVAGCDSPDPATLSPPSTTALAPGVSAALEVLVTGDRVPGAQAVITDRDRRQVLARGVGDIASGAPFAEDARVRIGSNTKTFVATVALQLVGEGKWELDAPIERYLPNIVRGNGIDGNRITVRNLLQHTSGLPDYTSEPDFANEDTRFQQRDPADMVRGVLSRQPARFEPGVRWEYSNTNYLLVGMAIERVTGHAVGEEVTHRIIEPLGLRATSYPRLGDAEVPDPHPLGYLGIDGRDVEFTRLDPSVAGAAGAMISTGAELNQFFLALVGGRLLAPAQLAEMQRTVPAEEMGPGFQYGLGLARMPSSCGRQVWGHGGSIFGYRTRGGATPDGRAATVTVNQHPSVDQVKTDMLKAVDVALCSPS
ncbi:serine hydrolase domain-containing protein [Nocardia sp. NPDC052566]|uniref:serine hydrolase domain-containing protein n=1 Tax=Nocardia sp. NPDC052566 TaxID=3364330 RepID=UPI0037CB35B4